MTGNVGHVTGARCRKGDPLRALIGALREGYARSGRIRGVDPITNPVVLDTKLIEPGRKPFVTMPSSGGLGVRNAVSLNSVTSNAARAVGPAIAGILIATVGVGVCFLASSSVATPLVSGAACSLLIVLSPLYFQA
jgi:hypothetical protein